MEVGAVETTLEVKGTGSLIETETARISDNKTAEIIKHLPLNQRALWTFHGQNPAVVQTASGNATRHFSGRRHKQSHPSVDKHTISNSRDVTHFGFLGDNARAL